MKDIVLNHIRKKGCQDTANRFQDGALSERWFTWFDGYLGSGFTPTTNAQESWHRTVKRYPRIGPLHRASDDLVETVFPTML